MENTVLTRVKKYIIASCNITEEEYILDIRKYLKQVFKNLRSSNNEIVKLRIKRNKSICSNACGFESHYSDLRSFNRCT